MISFQIILLIIFQPSSPAQQPVVGRKLENLVLEDVANKSSAQRNGFTSTQQSTGAIPACKQHSSYPSYSKFIIWKIEWDISVPPSVLYCKRCIILWCCWLLTVNPPPPVPHRANIGISSPTQQVAPSTQQTAGQGEVYVAISLLTKHWTKIEKRF